MESALLQDYFGNFSTRGERYYFCVRQVRFMQGEIEINIGKLRTQKNSNFFFGWRGPLVMIFRGVGAGGPDGVGQGCWQGARWGRVVRARRARWQGRDGMAGGRIASWQLLSWWRQEEGGGQMTGGSGAGEGMAGSLRQRGPDGRGGRW